MKNLWCWVLLAFIGSPQAWSQQVVYSAYDKWNGSEDAFAVVGKIDNRIYTYRSAENAHYLEAFNESMNKTAVVILDFFPPKIYDVQFIAYPNQLLVLYQSLVNTTLIQYAAILDEKGMLKKSPIKIDEVRTGILGPMKKYFQYAHSADKKKVLCYRISNGRKQISFEGFWLDDDLNVIKKVKSEYHNSHNLEATLADVANNGSLYLSAMSNEGTKNYSAQYALLIMGWDDKKFSAIPLPLGQNYMTDHHIKLDEQNSTIYLGGFYSAVKNGNVNGVIYAHLPMGTNKWDTPNFYPFTQEVKQQTGDRNVKKAFNQYNVKQLITKHDGGIVLIAENNFINLRTDYNNSFGYYSYYYTPLSSRTIREYYYGDLLALSYNAKGEMEWHQMIPKEQISYEDGGRFSSYGLLNTGGLLGFVYNDFNSRRSSVHFTTLQGDGVLKQKSLGNVEENDPDWLPRAGKQISAHEMVVPCLSRRKLCFAKIAF